jgi:uncharacterized membrane protein YfcA
MTLNVILKTIAVGLAAGYLSGQFGIGGGLITTPAIRLVLSRSAAVAIGTPLVVIIPSALTGAFNYSRRGYIHQELVLILSASGLIGVLGGSILTAYFSAHLIMLLTAVIIFLTGIRFFFSGNEQASKEEEPLSGSADSAGPSKNVLGKAILVGLAAGVFSGFLGLGGGVILIPALVFVFKLKMKQALGTSLVCVSIFAIPGSIVHFFLRHVDLGLALLLIIGTIPGAYVGSKVALKTPEKTLSLLFGLLLVVLALYFGSSELISLIP